jgi:plastocyanin
MKVILGRNTLHAVLVVMILSFLTGTGTGRAEEVKSGTSGNMEVSMTASSFKFEPSVIQVGQLGNLTIRVHNTAGSEHNITVKDPTGKIIASADLPAEKTVSLSVDLKAPGTYEFYCDKAMHALFGMKGEIRVSPKQP